MKKVLSYASIATAVVLFAACGGEQKPAEETTSAPAAHQHAAPAADTVYITIAGDDKMTFDTKEINVRAGQTVVLTLKHVGVAPKSTMGHNFILLGNDITLADFGQKAVAAVDNDYIPESEAHHIIAHTKMLGGGESDTITFPAPEKGTYEFLCSFPGHYAMMKGIFNVE